MEFADLLSNAQQSVQLLQGGTNLAASLKQYFNKSENGKVSAEEGEALLQEIQSALLDARVAQLAVLDQLIALKQTMLENDRRGRILERYILTDTGHGSMILTLRDDLPDSEIRHSICPHCADEDRKSILQNYSNYSLTCNHCRSVFRIDTRPPSLRRSRAVR